MIEAWNLIARAWKTNPFNQAAEIPPSQRHAGECLGLEEGD